APTRLYQTAAGRIVLSTHVKPDGDAFGSVVALVASLRQLGCQAKGCFVPPVPQGLKRMHGFQLIDADNDLKNYSKADFYIVVDTSAWSQLGPAAAIIKENLDNTLIIDHHLNGDVPAKHRYIDSQAAACCQIIAPLVEGLLSDQGGLEKLEDEPGR